jgi:hypothetical protein
MPNGPIFFSNPFARKPSAFSDPRYGVPNVTSNLVSRQPSRHSRK